MENKIELTAFQYVSYWWINRMKEFVQDVIKVGYSSNEGVEFTQIFAGLNDQHWRILYLKLAQLIEEEYNKENKFVQSTKSVDNGHYVGHGKINEMLKSIIHLDIPNAKLNPTGQMSINTSIFEEDGKPTAFLYNDDAFDKIVVKADLCVEKNYILTGDKSFLGEENNNSK